MKLLMHVLKFSITLCFFISLNIQAALDTRGTDFVFAFGPNFVNPSNTVKLFITGEADAQGTVEVAGLNIVEVFSVKANQVTEVILPAAVQVQANNQITDLGVRVTTDHEVTIYGLNSRPASSDAFTALPNDVLGLEYLIMSYRGYTPVTPSQLLVTGVYDHTEVTIIPKQKADGRKEGEAFTITLNAGQTYLLSAESSYDDLTGSSIVASSPISVMGVTQCAHVPTNRQACDHLAEMLPPVNTWGQSFVLVPLALRPQGDVVRVLASQDNTKVWFAGIEVAELQKGQHYENWSNSINPLTQSTEITASAPVSVAQYSTGLSYGDSGYYDPFMMLIPPSEQFLSSYTFVSLGESAGFKKGFVNITAPSNSIETLILNGEELDVTLFSQIGQSGFSGAQVPLTEGSYTMSGSEPFGIYAYGFGNADSYGYFGGQQFKAINSNGDRFAPNLRLELLGDYMIGRATDSEDINADNVLDPNEDLNRNSKIDRRNEDLNDNGLIDPNEDVNSDSVLDKDSGILRIELSTDSENLKLEKQGFVPGVIMADFIVSRINPALSASGRVIITDAGGNKTEQPINFISTPLLTQVRVISTFSNNQIELTENSFSREPDRIEVMADKTEVEWNFTDFPTEKIETLSYELIMRNAKAGETRLVLHDLELTYQGTNGQPINISLGTRAVTVAPSAFTLTTNIDKIRYQPQDSLIINSWVRNLGKGADSTSLQVDILDAQKNLVSQLPVRQINLAADAGELINDMQFSVTGLVTGQYTVRAQLKDSQDQVVRSSDVPFTVVTESDQLVDLASDISTDRPNYGRWDSVEIYARLQNMADNSNIGATGAELKVLASDGQVIYQQNRDISSIVASAVQQFNFTLPLNVISHGTYRIIWSVTDQNSGEALTTSSTSFLVVENTLQSLLGEVSSENNRIYNDATNQCYFKLTNRGESDIDNLPLALSILHVDSEALISRTELNSNLTAKGTDTSSFMQSIDFSAQHKPFGGYACVLEAQVDGIWQLLASSSFEVQAPKVDTSIQLGSKGRVLILTDEPRQCSALTDIHLSMEFGNTFTSSAEIEFKLSSAEGDVLDIEYLTNFGIDVNDSSQSNGADLTIHGLATGEFEIKIEGQAQNDGTSLLDKNYQLEVTYKSGWFTRTVKHWSLDTSCDRPFTLGEIYEDARLVAWHPWLGHDDHLVDHEYLTDTDPFGPLSGPSVSQQNEFLQQLLNDSGWQYTLVHNADDFSQAHRLGGYTGYLLLSERPMLHWKVQKEIREAVFAGKGLVVAGTFDKRNVWLEHALGIKIIGRHPWAEDLLINQSDFSNAWQAVLPINDTVQGLFLNGAEELAQYSLTHDDLLDEWQWLDQSNFNLVDVSAFKRRAITQNHYGKGEAIFFGFDLLLQASSAGQQSDYADLLRQSLLKIQPPIESQLALTGGVIPLSIQWQNQRGATSIQSEILLPLDGRLSADLPFELINDQWLATIELAQSQVVNSQVYLKLKPNAEPQHIVLATTLGTDASSVPIQLPSSEASITLVAPELIGSEATLALLDNLVWDYWYRLDYRAARLKFQLAQEAIAHQQWDTAQTLLLLCADLLLLGDESDIVQTRQQLQQHIQEVGQQLALQVQ